MRGYLVYNQFMASRVKKIIAFIKKHERALVPAALLLGFIVDNFTLKRIDLPFENILLGTHLLIVGTCIVLINSRERTFFGRIGLGKYTGVLRIIMQFSLGALFSGFFIFYTRSGTLATSWVFFIILIGLLIGNEFLREKYDKIIYQIGVYFVAIFSYSIFLVPILLKDVGALPFLLSGVFSLALITMVLLVISIIIPHLIKHYQMRIVTTILIIFGTFNTLYFTNIVPPIPLSLKEKGAYYKVERVNQDMYHLYEEDIPWYRFFERLNPTLKLTDNASAYVFSSVFAPTDITTTLYHQWYVYDEREKKWLESDRIVIPVRGGRDGGYRGYSVKNSVFPGDWRVDILTERDQLLGRVNFEIEAISETPKLEVEAI